MTSMVARLRERFGVEMSTGEWALQPDAYDTLLTIVERFAADEFPVDYNQNSRGGRLVCEWCDVDSDEGDWMEPMAFPHAPDCPWLLARKACGMDDEG